MAASTVYNAVKVFHEPTSMELVSVLVMISDCGASPAMNTIDGHEFTAAVVALSQAIGLSSLSNTFQTKEIFQVEPAVKHDPSIYWVSDALGSGRTLVCFKE